MLHTLPDDAWDVIQKIHVRAPFRLIRAAAPYLRIKVCVSSSSPCPFFFFFFEFWVYCAKAWLPMLHITFYESWVGSGGWYRSM